jgi:hypothetical protein
VLIPIARPLSGPASLFIVTTSPCRDWVICAPAAFLRSGSHLSGLSWWIYRRLSISLALKSKAQVSPLPDYILSGDILCSLPTHRHLVCELHSFPPTGGGEEELGCGLPPFSIFPGCLPYQKVIALGYLVLRKQYICGGVPAI